MTGVLRKFVPRAPRYVLRPNDKHMVRYAPEHSRGPMAVHKTKLINLSETGLAITMDANAAPRVGERMKVELPIPGVEGQLAWWAIVVRVQLQESNWWTVDADEDNVLVALRFQELPDGHRKAIQSGLEAKFFEALRERRRKQLIFVKQKIAEHGLKIFAWTILAITAAAALYILSRPSDNYDSERGSPWGRRFQFFEFEKQNNK